MYLVFPRSITATHPTHHRAYTYTQNKHTHSFIPENGAVLELGASAHSYMPEDLPLASLVGVGVNEVRTCII